MGKVKNWYMERAEKFWDIAHETIKECEFYGEFEKKMLAVPEKDGFLAFNEKDTDCLDELKYELEDAWNEYWSKYA